MTGASSAPDYDDDPGWRLSEVHGEHLHVIQSATPSPDRRPASLHGYLVINKPAGLTSFAVVSRVRRLLREKKIGHAGTLDPAATGVLPLAVGSATKTLEYLSAASKTYLAEITFGVETDSHDIDGRVTRIIGAESLSRATVEAALSSFLGEVEQIPPMHAAIKVGGRKLYELARRGEEIDRAARTVTFHRLELREWRPPVATILVDCSKGTYIRSLARDLGAAVGTGAYLSRLVRLRSGPFYLSQALTLDELAAAGLPDSWSRIALPPDAPIQSWPAIVLDEANARRWRHGLTVPAGDRVAGPVRAYDTTGQWLGTGHADAAGTGWQPRKVVPASSAA